MTSDEDGKTFRRLGLISLVLGFLGATDSAYEIHQTEKARPAAIFEFVLAQAAIVSGLGLMQRRGWALKAAVVTAVAGFIHALLAVVILGSALLRLLTILGVIYDHDLGVDFALRLLLILAQVLFWPIVLGHLYIDLQCSEDPAAARNGKRKFWTCVLITAALTVLIEMILVRLPG
jgi:hypothetical protein